MSKPVGFGFLEFKTFTTQMLKKKKNKNKTTTTTKAKAESGDTGKECNAERDLCGLSQSISCEPHGSAHFTHEETEAEQ